MEATLKNTKLEQSLLALEKQERRAFLQFLQSSFFNKREDVLLLYTKWLLEGSLGSKTEVFEHVYPGAPYDAQRLHLCMSYLQRLAEQFFAYRQWREQPGACEVALVQATRRRGLETHFNEALRSALRQSEQQPLRNEQYYAQRQHLLWEEARYDQTRNATAVKNLRALWENADLVWLAQKLRLLCLHRTQEMLYRADDALRLDNRMEHLLERYNLAEHPGVGVWYYCLKMLENPEEPLYFSQFKAPLLAQDGCFDAEEIRDLYRFALNYCIRQVNAGRTVFFHDIMDFYKDGLQKGHLLENGVLSRFTYHNIVAAGLQTGEYEWVEDFIARYKNSLERTYRESSYSFNRARLEYKRKRYDEALGLLQHSNYYDPLLGLAAKTIAMKIYYETGEEELLFAHLEAMKHYVRRKTVLGYHRDNYLSMVRYMQKLLTLNRFDKTAVQTLKAKIVAEKVLMEREWLLEQL